MERHLLKPANITKYYGSSLSANVSTYVNAGEVTCVLGEQRRRREVDVHQDPVRSARSSPEERIPP